MRKTIVKMGILNTLKSLFRLKFKYGNDLFKGGFITAMDIISYKLNKKPWGGILFFGWDITYKCNAKCSYCDRWKRKDHDEVSTENALKVVDDIAKIGTWNLSIGGGEPLLRKDMLEIIKYAREKKINVNLNTNGFLIKARAKEIIDSGLNSITISVESSDAKVHDKIRGLSGLFDKLCLGMDELKKYKKRPSIKIRFDITRENYKEIEKYVLFWKDKVDDIVFQPIHESLSNDFITPESIKFKEKDEKEFRKIFSELQRKYPQFKTPYYDEFPAFFFDRKKIEEYTCYAGYFTLQVDPAQNVYPCTAFINKLGNLKENSIMEIWNGEKIKKWREIARAKKNKCSCWFNCNGQVNCYLSKLMGK